MLRHLFAVILLSVLVNSSVWSALTRDIGIADFTNVNKNPELENYTRAIPTLIFTHLANSQKLSLVDRQELDKMLEEMVELPEMGIVDAETAAQVGRAVGARYMFIGQLISFRGESGMRIRITTRLVDVESTRVVAGWQVAASDTELDVQAIELARNILKLLFPINPWGAAGRSLLVPGWGQFANKRASGYVFLPLAIAALGGLAYTQYAYTQANDDYEEINAREHKTGVELQEAADKRDDRERLRWIAVGTVAGVWLVNAVDAFVEAHLLNKQWQSAEARFQLQARMKHQDVRVLWATRF